MMMSSFPPLSDLSKTQRFHILSENAEKLSVFRKVSFTNTISINKDGCLWESLSLLCLFCRQVYIVFIASSSSYLGIRLWAWMVMEHMGAEAPYSFKEVSGGPPYCKLTTRHHIFWYYVSPNQTCKVLGDFGPKSWLTLRHVCGHVARVTCLLRVPCCGPWAVDDFRHWNFSIC